MERVYLMALNTVWACSSSNVISVNIFSTLEMCFESKAANDNKDKNFGIWNSERLKQRLM